MIIGALIMIIGVLTFLGKQIRDLTRARSSAVVIYHSGAPWVRFFGKSLHARNFVYDVSVRPTVETVRVEVGREYCVWGRECSGHFPWREIAW